MGKYLSRKFLLAVAALMLLLAGGKGYVKLPSEVNIALSGVVISYIGANAYQKAKTVG